MIVTKQPKTHAEALRYWQRKVHESARAIQDDPALKVLDGNMQIVSEFMIDWSDDRSQVTVTYTLRQVELSADELESARLLAATRKASE